MLVWCCWQADIFLADAAAAGAAAAAAVAGSVYALLLSPRILTRYVHLLVVA